MYYISMILDRTIFKRIFFNKFYSYDIAKIICILYNSSNNKIYNYKI